MDTLSNKYLSGKYISGAFVGPGDIMLVTYPEGSMQSHRIFIVNHKDRFIHLKINYRAMLSRINEARKLNTKPVRIGRHELYGAQYAPDFVMKHYTWLRCNFSRKQFIKLMFQRGQSPFNNKPFKLKSRLTDDVHS